MEQVAVHVEPAVVVVVERAIRARVDRQTEGVENADLAGRGRRLRLLLLLGRWRQLARRPLDLVDRQAQHQLGHRAALLQAVRLAEKLELSSLCAGTRNR